MRQNEYLWSKGLTLYHYDKTLEESKLKLFVDDFFCVAQTVLDRFENVLGTGENADYQRFLLFSECFQKIFSVGS